MNTTCNSCGKYTCVCYNAKPMTAKTVQAANIQARMFTKYEINNLQSGVGLNELVEITSVNENVKSGMVSMKDFVTAYEEELAKAERRTLFCKAMLSEVKSLV